MYSTWIEILHVRTHVNRNSLKFVEIAFGWGPVTYDFTLHLRVHDHTIWFWRWDGLWALSLGLSQYHGHGSWLVCEVALSSSQFSPFIACHLTWIMFFFSFIIIFVNPRLFHDLEIHQGLQFRYRVPHIHNIASPSMGKVDFETFQSLKLMNIVVFSWVCS